MIKKDKFCINRNSLVIISVLVLLIGIALFANYSASQKLSTNSKAETMEAPPTTPSAQEVTLDDTHMAMAITLAGSDQSIATTILKPSINGHRYKDLMALQINGEKEMWYTIKESKEGYMVMYRPVSNEWLKVAQGTGSGKERTVVLQRAVEAMKASLRLSDMPNPEKAVQFVNVTLPDGSVRSAMRMNHLGDTLEYLYNNFKLGKTGLPQVTENEAKTIIIDAMDRALSLLKEGYFFSDSNFGNIIAYKTNAGNWRAILIDFTNMDLLKYKNPSAHAVYALRRGFIEAAARIKGWDITNDFATIAKLRGFDMEKNLAQIKSVTTLYSDEVMVMDDVGKSVIREARLVSQVLPENATTAEIPAGTAVKVETIIAPEGRLRFLTFFNHPWLKSTASRLGYMLKLAGDTGIVMMFKEYFDNAWLPKTHQAAFTVNNTSNNPKLSLSLPSMFQGGLDDKMIPNANDARNNPGYEELVERVKMAKNDLKEWKATDADIEKYGFEQLEQFKKQSLTGWQQIKIKEAGILGDVDRDTDLYACARLTEQDTPQIILMRIPQEIKNKLNSNDTLVDLNNQILLVAEQKGNTWVSTATTPQSSSFEVAPYLTWEKKDMQVMFTTISDGTISFAP